MAIISIKEASLLTGKSIPTLYRHAKDGRLSKFGDGFETSELLRVYGEFKGDKLLDYQKDNQSKENDSQDLLFLKMEIDLLRAEVESLKKDKIEAKEREDKLFDIIHNRLPAPVAPVATQQNANLESNYNNESFFNKIKKLF